MQHQEEVGECSLYKHAWVWGQWLSLHGCKGSLGCSMSWAAPKDLPLTSFLSPTETSLGVTSILAGNMGQREDAALPLPCLLGSAQPLAVQRLALEMQVAQEGSTATTGTPLPRWDTGRAASSHLGQFSSGAVAWQTQPCLQEPPQAP